MNAWRLCIHFQYQAGLLGRCYSFVLGILKCLVEMCYTFYLSKESRCPVKANTKAKEHILSGKKLDPIIFYSAQELFYKWPQFTQSDILSYAFSENMLFTEATSWHTHNSTAHLISSSILHYCYFILSPHCPLMSWCGPVLQAIVMASLGWCTLDRSDCLGVWPLLTSHGLFCPDRGTCSNFNLNTFAHG